MWLHCSHGNTDHLNLKDGIFSLVEVESGLDSHKLSLGKADGEKVTE